MRYTTIINIADMPAVYKNLNCRLLYLHLTLAAGYHDEDRDQVAISLRDLAFETGLTLAAVRHAARVLTKYGLVTRTGSLWTVKKWLAGESITPREKTAQNKKNATNSTAADERRQQQEKLDGALAQQRAEREAISSGRQEHPFVVYYEQKLKEAAAGDLEAAQICASRKELYEQIKQNKPS